MFYWHFFIQLGIFFMFEGGADNGNIGYSKFRGKFLVKFERQVDRDDGSFLFQAQKFFGNLKCMNSRRR